MDQRVASEKGRETSPEREASARLRRSGPGLKSSRNSKSEREKPAADSEMEGGAGW
jgi:hypothetical protein